jgi:hypothetical protein
MSPRHVIRSRLLRAALVLSVLAGAVLLAVLPGPASSADPAGQAGPPPRAPAAKAPDGPPNAVAAQIRTAPAGRTLAHGPRMTVDELVLPTTTVARLTISGEFPLRALDPTVSVDGKPVGRGIGAPDGRSIGVAVADPVKTGSTVSYRYGTGPETTVGTLTLGAK